MIKLGTYEHYKKKQYEVIGEAIHSESGEELVLYKALYELSDLPPNTIWARPKSMFLDIVVVDGNPTPRFKHISPSLPDELIA